MSDPSAPAWLRPSLLERLTDHAPERKREPARAGSVDDAQLRQWIRRDLAWLLNTTHFAAGCDLRDFPEVNRSVLNYGIPDLTGRTLSSAQSEHLERQIVRALVNYESRLVHETIQVQVSGAPNGSGKPTLYIEIAAVLRTEPLPISLRVRAEVDVESGRVAIEENALDKEKS